MGSTVHKKLVFAIVLAAIAALGIGVLVHALRLSKGYYLFAAVRAGDARRVKGYLDAGHNPDVRNELGMTPLHFAAYYGFDSCTKVLVEGGAMVSATDRRGNTPLHFAAEENKRQTVSILLDAGANADAKNADGDTPLHLAASSFGREVGEALLESGASVDVKNMAGRTALFKAVELGDKQMVAVLVKHGASLAETDVNGNALTDVAAKNQSMLVLLERLTTQPSRR